MNSRHTGVLMVLILALAVAGVAGAQEYGEAPMLEEMVAEGELPPVEERVPEQPYVVEPEERVGDYGGTARVASSRPDGVGDDHMMMSFYNTLVSPGPKGEGIYPHFAREVEVSDDYTVYTVHFREGVRWSDGEPFTTADLMFWYEDILLNEELNPVIGVAWMSEGEVAELTALDDYTLEISFAGPEPFFMNRLIHESGWSMFYPKHFLKQYHPSYTPEDELEEMADEEGFDAWYDLFWDRDSSAGQVPLNYERPTLAPYVLEHLTSDRRVYVRNPYFWKVDTEGNQLPYIDRIDTEIVADREILNGMIISGDLDFAAFENDIRNYPLYHRYGDEAGYRTILWESGMSNEVVYMFNMTYDDPGLQEVFRDVRFRRAMSLAIDRDEINEVVYFGRAEPMQYTVHEGSQYFDPEFAESYIEYDPDRANALLDEMGLDERDDEGYRLRPDGERLSFTLEFYDTETPKLPNVELVTEHWREVGVDVRTRPISGELQAQRAPANLMQASLWHGDLATDVLFPIDPYYFVPYHPVWSKTIWPEWARYFHTDGEEGEVPPDEIVELRETWEELMVEVDDDRRFELAEVLLETQAEKLWTIGTVGRAPFPIVASNELRNVPEEGLWSWDTLWTTTRDPEQFFFEQ